MKIISSILGAFILVIVLCFALSNGQSTDVSLWPLDGAASTPLYVVGLAPLLFGLILGGLWGWLCSLPSRLKVRRLTKELGVLHSKIYEQQMASNFVQSVSSVKKHFWERRP